MLTVFDFVRFFYSTPIPSCVIQDEHIKSVNKVFVETTGYTELELLESPAARLLHPEDRAGVLENIVNCQAGKDMRVEFRAFSREGEIVHVNSHFTRVELNGQPAVLVQTIDARVKDMTERRKALNELFNSERKYRRLVELAWEGIWAIDDKAVTTYVNPRMAEILEYTAEEMIGRSLFSFMDEQSIEIYSAFFEKLRQGFKARHDFEFLNKDGRRVYTSLETMPLSNNAGSYTGALAVVSDITRRKQAEKALNRELEVSAALAELSRELLLTDSFDEIAKLVLDEAKRLTYSRFGYVGYIDAAAGHIVFPTLTKEIWDTCQVDDKNFVFEKPLLSNSPAVDPRYLGTIPGHIPINRFLSVPAVIGEKLVGQVALANSSRDYTDLDLEIVERISYLFAIAIQRKWTEENRKQSEDKYRKLFETMAQGVVYQNIAGEIISANPAAEKILGASCELMKARTSKEPLWRTIREDGTPLPAEESPPMVALKTGKEVRNVVMGILLPETGERRWIKVINAAPQFRPGEEIPYQVYNIFDDITELKAAEDKLLNANQQLLDIIESMPDATFVIDRDKKVIAWNQGMVEMTGVRKEEIIGRGDYAYAVPFYGEARPIMIDLIFEENREAQHHYSFLKKEGNTLYTETFVPKVYGGKGAYLWGKMSGIYNTDGELIGAIESIHDITERRLAEGKTRQSEALLRSIIESPQNIIMFSLDQNYRYLSFNKAHSKTMKNIWGADIETGKSMLEYIAYPEDREKARTNFDRALSGEHFSQVEEYGDEELGRKIWEDIYSPIVIESGEIIGLTIFCSDISERILAQEKLRAANQQLLDIIDFLPDATFVIDRGGIVIAWNRAMEEMTGLPKEDILGKGDYAYSVPFYGEPRQLLIDLVFAEDRDTEQNYEYTERRGTTIFGEVYIQSLYGGEGGYLWGKASPLLDSDGNVAGAIESIRDITMRKNAEEQLKYLSLHDYLTGLYNRTFFEEGVQRASDGRFDPIGIIVCDLDGLKFINDTLGHNAGDSILVAAANVIGSVFRKGDIVARVGGDEYAVLLTHSNEKTVEEACDRIRGAIEKYNLAGPEIPLNISMGFAVGSIETASVGDLFKEADNNMYREKLHRSKSARNAIVRTLMKALEARDFITEGHALRLQDYVTRLARAIGMPVQSGSDLNLLAKFHDIGKVGVRDSILFKPGALTTEEALEMQRHTEIGHRIAQSAPDLEPIADWILKHHEWWNGSGYPLGLKGEEIPLECRILAIADAYDAMTNDRPYRRAMTHDRAVDELKKFAGVQFDPNLVLNFLGLLGKI